MRQVHGVLLVVLLGSLSGCTALKRGHGAASPNQATAQIPTRGGMWMPEQMALHAQTLRQLGLKIDPTALTDPQALPLSAVVFLGGCSASFVSEDGLIITNHHCAAGALQNNSSATQDLVHNGFVAKSRAEEKSNGPAARVFVTQKQTDVTSQMTQGLAAIADDRERLLVSQARSKALVKSCESQSPNVRCEVDTFFGGAQYRLIERLEIKDVRLVFAPPEGIGNFGGEVDNWQWPRHAGDFAFFRAYVGQDGKPAEYSTHNVPYHPKAHLKIATQPLHEGDLVFVAGYPAHTEQFATPSEVDELVRWYFPRQIRHANEHVAAIEKAGEHDPATALKGYPTIRGLDNRKKFMQGALEGLEKGGVAAEKARQYATFRAWVQKKAPAEIGVLDDLNRVLAERSKSRVRRANLDELLQSSVLLQGAIQIVRLAREREKPDEQRLPDFQERNVPVIRDGLDALDKRYSQKIDSARLLLALDRVGVDSLTDRSAAFKILGGELVQPAARKKNITGLFIGSTLPSTQARLKYLSYDLKKLQAHWDPLLKVACQLLPVIEQQEAEDQAFDGKMLILRPRYMTLLQKFVGHAMAPDANRTLRITYGTVKGYSPAAGAAALPAFTKVSEIPKKNTGKDPFIAPGVLLEKIHTRRFGPYADALLGEVPVDFVADLHIAGGNSGSPTLDKEGNLVGLAFDGNYEAMASNWLFMPQITRSIHVDIRYVLWLLDAVYNDDALLKELGVQPAL